MTNGGGQLTVIRAVTSNGTVSPLALLYHYDPGTTDKADIYSDEALTTAVVQPFVSDAAGRFIFYAKGDFDFLIKAADDATLLDTLDDWHISKGQALVTDYSTAYPAANATNKGQLYAKIDATPIVRGLAINKGTAFVELYTADASGNQQLGSVVSKTMPVYNIQHADWGATPNVAVDQTTAIQSAITAIMAANGGVLYCPQGVYQVDGSLNIDNTPIKIVGDGAGHTIFKQTADPSAPMIDYDSSTITDKVVIEGIAFTTTVVGSNTGIDLSWTGGSKDTQNNLYINDVFVGPYSTSSATAYFADNIILSGALHSSISNSMISGHDTLTAGSDGMTIIGATYMAMSNMQFQNLETALHTGGSSNCVLTNSTFRSVNRGLWGTTDMDRWVITGCVFTEIITQALIFAGAGPVAHWYNTITGNSFAGINDTCDLIVGVDVFKSNIISGNSFSGVTGDTSSGISLGGNADSNSITGNAFSTLDTGIIVSGDDNTIVGNNHYTVTTQVTDTGSNMYGYNSPGTQLTVASAAGLGAGIAGIESQDFWDVTGTVNVTSIDAAAGTWTGRIITLLFAAILTFTDGNNLTLAGNFSTSADDMIMLQYNGTNWVEISRSAN